MGDWMNDGRRLHFREAGSGFPLLILPGNTASSAHHLADLDRLGAQYHVYAFDPYGTGQSERAAVWPQDWWGLAARDSAALMQAQGHAQWAVLGTSGGAVAALMQALLFPDAVRLVVADSLTPSWQPDAMRRVVAARQQRLPGQIAFWQAGHGDDWEQVVDADSDLFMRFAASGADWFGDRLAGVRCPTLLTGSFADSAIPNPGERLFEMARQIPSADLYISGRGDHPFMWSEADAFYALLLPWLARQLA